MTSKSEQIRSRRKRKRVLGLEAIVDVALGIIDAEGVDAVSMRRVAAEFDTGPASLYAYVQNKQDLFERILDRVVGAGELPDDSHDLTWQELVRAWAHSARSVFMLHQDVAKLSFAYIPHGEAVIEGAERIMGAMIEGGVPPQVAAWAMDIVSLYIGADAYEGWLLEKRYGDESDRETLDGFRDELSAIGDQFAALSPERYPYMVKYAPLLIQGDSDERFAFGINMLIAGFEAQISG